MISPRRAPHGWIALGAWALTAAVAFTPAWRLVELKGFDLLTVTGPLRPVESPVVIVGIDEPSFAELGLQWPWPRSLHARLIERLSRAGAAVVAFDVLFAEPSSPGDDAALAAAIRGAGNVVLMADETVDAGEHVVQRRRIEPLPMLTGTGAATTGIVRVPLDADGVIRRVPQGASTFWQEILAMHARRRGAPAAAVPGEFIRFEPARSFAYASYYQALEPEQFLPRGFFTDRIVVVGLSVTASPDPGARQADMFATPLFLATGRLMPGPEVQANIVETARLGRAIAETPRAVTLAALALAGLLSAWSMRAWRPVRSAAAALALMAAAAGTAWGAFHGLDRWLPAVSVLAGTALLYVAEGGAAFLQEQALRRRIRQAFTHYVSPHLVDQMIAHPERLRLGGERRELTIVFSDLAGFTTIAERLSPEETVQLINRHLTDVADIVIRSGGTVDKFVGDGLMAFWGAPVDDPEHALHACEAAAAMQSAVQRLREELAGTGRPAIHMRVGIHTGSVVVGNMGSATRFDYTATGDDVNLASRLEGVNKLYGTGIVLSEATAERLRGRLGLRRLDRVRVKGKTQPVDIYTLETDPALAAVTEEAVAAYRAARWDEAEKLWRDALERRPDDRLAPIYLERIAAFRRSPPPADWDGAVTLEQK